MARPARKQPQAEEFAQYLVSMLENCVQVEGRSEKKRREKIWRQYYKCRTSGDFTDKWHRFLRVSTSGLPSPIFFQFITNSAFKQIIKQKHPLKECKIVSHESQLSFEEVNGIRYAAGYIPRALRKKLIKSNHPLKKRTPFMFVRSI